MFHITPHFHLQGSSFKIQFFSTLLEQVPENPNHTSSETPGQLVNWPDLAKVLVQLHKAGRVSHLKAMALMLVK